MLDFLDLFEDILWSYLCVPALVLLGIVLCGRGNLAQVRLFPQACLNFWEMLKNREKKEGAVHPMQAFFACVGGCIGIGNIVGVCAAVQIGGPGALIWLWVTAAVGAILKYAEVYLGMRYRVTKGQGSYRGGPMYYLSKVFHGAWAPLLASILLCLYGVEVYQFNVIAASLSTNFGWSKEWVVAGLLILVLYAGLGGIQRVGRISGTIIPLFIVLYLAVGAWVIWAHIEALPAALTTAFYSAFTGHAAIGGFAGSSLMMAITHGVRRACYSGDLGVGYASVIHSESSEAHPAKQASLAVVDIFVDSFVICSMTILLVLVTGVWQEGLPEELIVQQALATVFPYAAFFMPPFIFLLGYSTINAYFVVGLNCAEFLAGSKGKWLYFVYACVALLFFSYFDPSTARSAMAIVGGSLLLINCYAIYKLRDEIDYGFGAALLPTKSCQASTSSTPELQRQTSSLALNDSAS